MLYTHRIEHQHLAQQMHGLGGRMRTQRVQRVQRRQLLCSTQHMRSGALARVTHVLQRRSAQQFGYQFQLLNGTLSLEQNAPTEQFAENAAHRPEVDGRRIVASAHQDFGRPIVLRHDLLGHVLLLVGLLDARESKIANLLVNIWF